MGYIILVIILVFRSFFLICQGIFTLIWMLYAWEDPEKTKKEATITSFRKPLHAITALIPVRNEEHVIEDTIASLQRIEYPAELKEALILCRFDDVKTIEKAQRTIQKIKSTGIRLVIFNDTDISKPIALNHGLKYAKGDIITIFDAEDEPHPQIYSVMNTLFLNNNVDIIQAGVQLMNFDAKWYAPFNVLEYFFWFKSGLKLFLQLGNAIPLGGNTVFIKKAMIEKVGGWKNCLTEDADIGIRLFATGAKAKVYYDERFVTQEEVPSTLKSFIKQRTRWNQGFLQILFAGDWLKLPEFKQKIAILYILLCANLPSILLIYILLGFLFAKITNLPILLSLLSFVPSYVLLLQIFISAITLYEFTKTYKKKFSFIFFLKVVLLFIPYQLILLLASIRAVVRQIVNAKEWEKTHHLNAHRKINAHSVLGFRKAYE